MAIVKLPHKQRERFIQQREGYGMCVSSYVVGKRVAFYRGSVRRQPYSSLFNSPR